jgi:hypothetical protein
MTTFNTAITAAETVKNKAIITSDEDVVKARDTLTNATSAFNRVIQNGTNGAEESMLPITNVEDLTVYLETLPFGSAAKPSTVPLAVNVSTKKWESNSEALSYNGKYLILDLSACIATENTIQSDDLKMMANTYIKGVILPSTLTTIGDSAFLNCKYLTSVTIPVSVTKIGDSAFSGCTKLTSVTIPGSVTRFGASAFSGCTSLTSVTIPGSITSVTAANGVTSFGFGASAFSGCTKLTSVTIGTGVKSIWASAFSGYTSLTSVTIPSSVTSIGSYAFSGCTGLTSVTFGAGSNITTQWTNNAFGYYSSSSYYYDYYTGDNLWTAYTGGIKPGTYTRVGADWTQK